MKKFAWYPLIIGLFLLVIASGVMAEPEKGVIYINSNPSEAEIYLTSATATPDIADSLNVSDTEGFTPKQFFVEPGEYRIFLKKYGYTTWWSEKFTVVAGGETQNFGTVNLSDKNPVYGAIHIDSNPPGAELKLERIVDPDVNSLIYSKTPASLESLPPGQYNYTITMPGYYDYTGTELIKSGEVTEVYTPLTPLPDSADITFKTDPAGARVLLIGGKMDSIGSSSLEKIESVMNNFNGTSEEAEAAIKEEVSANTAIPSKLTYGFVGTTPFTMELQQGLYYASYSLDGYWKDGSIFNVTAGKDDTVEKTLTATPEFVDVYFESNVDEISGIDGEKGAHIYVNGVDSESYTPCWVSLPSERLVNVTFEKARLYNSVSITVDSTLFMGRASKWNKLIELSKSQYTITATSDEHSKIEPSGVRSVFAGDSYDFELSGDTPKYLAGNLTINRSYPATTEVFECNSDYCPYQLANVLGDVNLTLNSKVKQVFVNATAGKGGNVTPAEYEGLHYYDYGNDSVLYKFVPAEDYVIDKLWVDAKEYPGLDEIKFASMTDSHTVYGTFRPTMVTISHDVSEGGQLLDNGVPAESYKIPYLGCTHTYEIVPDAGYRINISKTYWEGVKDTSELGGESIPVISICNVTKDSILHVAFDKGEYLVKASAQTGGTISPSGEMTASYGDNFSFVSTESSGYSLSEITDNNVSMGPVSPYNITVFEDHDIVAFFRNAFTITPSANEGGIIEPSTPQAVEDGGSASFLITADTCNTIGDVLVDGESTGSWESPYTFTFTDVHKDHTIEAVFKPKTYNISVIENEGGIINPNGTHGNVTVNCGANQEFTIIPNSGNALRDLLVDGQSIGRKSNYTFESVVNDHTIEAIFVMPPIPDFSADRTRVPVMYPVSFHDLTKNNPTAWVWDLGDGTITDVREPVHYYTEVGNYTISLSAINEAAPDGVKVTKENYITVTNEPIACFTCNPEGGTVPSGVRVNFTDCSLNAETGISWGWNFGDSEEGAISKNTTHVYTSPGVYQVTHKVEKPYVGTDYAYDTVIIMQEPVADFTAHPVSGDAPLKVQFEDKSGGFPTSYSWLFGDNTGSFDQNPEHVYSVPGNYTVSLTITSDEGTDTKTEEGYIVVK